MDGGHGDDTVRLTRAKAAGLRDSDVPNPGVPAPDVAGVAPQAPHRGGRPLRVAIAAAVGLAGCALAFMLLWPDGPSRSPTGADTPGGTAQAGEAGAMPPPAGNPGQEIAGRQAPPVARPPDGTPVGSVSAALPAPLAPTPAAIPAPLTAAPAAIPAPLTAAPAAVPAPLAPLATSLPTPVAPSATSLPAPVAPAAVVSAPVIATLVSPPGLAPAEPEPLRGMVVLPVPQPSYGPVPLASEAELLATTTDRSVMLRLRENPAVFVLLFPTLDEQGRALNRIAALVEKAGQPRDRLLTDPELALAIERSGETPATWYLGHDYQGSDLARFFALAARDGIPLNPAEAWVRDRYLEARALVPGGSEVALISTANSDQRFDPAMRAAILRHEISHGNFFTLPAVRTHVLRVWRERFRDRDRQVLRAFLAREGYDTTNDLLMANEAMAYLLFTPDARFFSARLLGVTEPEVARLRMLMRDGLPLP